MIETYDTFMDLPLDVAGQDGNDLLVPGQFGIQYDSGVQSTAMPMLAPLELKQVAPFFHFKPGAGGRPVVAMKRGLRRAGALWVAPGKLPTGNHGPISQRALNKFKGEYGLPRNGVYDKATHRHLVPFMDDYALYLLNLEKKERDEKKKPTKEEQVRARILAAGMFLYNHRWQIPYSQYRPWHVTHIPRVPARLDCSAGTAWCYMNGGAPEPSGYPSWGYGNTWTQLDYARRRNRTVRVSQAEIGDHFQYDGHVAWMVGRREGVVRVWSMGSFPIKILDYNYRGDLIAVCRAV